MSPQLAHRAISLPHNNWVALEAIADITSVSHTNRIYAYTPQLFLRRLEISQIRRRLILHRGHDGAVPALEIGLIADLEDAFAVAAVLWPLRIFVRQAAIGLEHRPRTREGVIDQGDLVVEARWISLVDEQALLDDRFVVRVGRHAGRIERARTLQEARLDLQRVVFAVAVGVDPLADGITAEAWQHILRPVASVGEYPAMGLMGVIDPDVSRLRQHDDFHRTIDRHHGRHAGRQAGDAGEPVALGAFGLVGDALLENLLIFGRQRRLLTQPPWLGRIECGLATHAEPDRDPLAREIRIFGIIEGLRGERRHQESRRHSGGADQAAVSHALPLLFMELSKHLPEGHLRMYDSLSACRLKPGKHRC